MLLRWFRYFLPFFFFFIDPAPTEIYTLPLHAALPISTVPPSTSNTPTHADAPVPPLDARPMFMVSALILANPPVRLSSPRRLVVPVLPMPSPISRTEDRKSTRLNSSHSQISYAVFCLK